MSDQTPVPSFPARGVLIGMALGLPIWFVIFRVAYWLVMHS